MEKKKIDCIDGFGYKYERELSPEFNYAKYQETFYPAEKELMAVEDWNRILGNAQIQRRAELSSTYTDLGISVLESLRDNNHPSELLETFGTKMKPGEDLVLNMNDIENMSIKSTHRPLPVYYFTNKKLTLRTILDTGAATNYISTSTIDVLINKYKADVMVRDVEVQKVRLANGDREETSKVATLQVTNGEYNCSIDAFMLTLPNIDLILGLPWYQNSKPVIDFSSHVYYIQKFGKIIPLVPEENRGDLPTLCADTAIGSVKRNGKDKSSPQERIKKAFPECFNDDIIVSDRPWKHGIDTGDARPLKT